MKQELLEYLVRHCVREVRKQLKEGHFYKSAGQRPGPMLGVGFIKESETPTNANDFHVDAQGAWCKDCGYKGHAAMVGLGDLQYVCSNKKCKKAYRGGPQIRPHYRGLREEEETKGAAAPPEDDQGTADQPGIPKDKPTPDDPKKDEPKTDGPPSDAAPKDEPSGPPPSSELKGLIFVNPKDKAKLQKIQVQGQDEASIQRSLQQQAARIVGPRVKLSSTIARMVGDVLKNPTTSTYLYLGKYDPSSEEVYLMADRSLQVAKDGSIAPGEMTGTPVASVAPTYAPTMAGNQQPQIPLAEQMKLNALIRKVVSNVLDRK